MRVSFITTVRNEAETIADYLRSLSEQTRPPDEVIIVDGDSTDSTVAEIESQQERFPRLEVIVQPCNIAEGRNIAVEQATGDILVMSDAGSVLNPDWVEQIVAPFEADPEVEVVAGNWNILREPGLPELLRFFYLHSREDFRQGPARPNNPSARSFAIRREVWQELGGHPEFLYAGEDTLFNLKCQLQGRNSCFAEDALCHWRMHRNWRAFGRQVRNYGRAAGRLARKGALSALARTLRRTGVYAMLLALLIVASFQAWPLNIGLAACAALPAALVVLRDLAHTFARARAYGFGLSRSLQAVAVVQYGHFQRKYGTVLGLRDRATGDFERQVHEYMVARPDLNRAASRTEETFLQT